MIEIPGISSVPTAIFASFQVLRATCEVLRFLLTGKTVRWKGSCYGASLSSGDC